ncbi:putative O Protein-disulfide isomerase [Chlamydiales bacterium STE3]|nr:putative O Protein-disulfide isomerase [Chlamydiales bacterium STE3]
MSSTKWQSFFFNLATFCLLAGLVLTYVSWLELCTETCTEAHNYQFYGAKFEVFGGIYFICLNFIHLLSKKYRLLTFLAAFMIAAGLGAELMFIWLQKTQIGHFCSVCLAIAASLSCAGIFYYLTYFNNRSEFGGYMKGFSLLTAFAIGFVVAFSGIAKVDRLEAAQQEIKEQIKFGKVESPIEVYLFTDWSCTACRSIEPNLSSIFKKIENDASFTFVDLAIHHETLNYVPYNLALMMNYKPTYFQARDALTQLSIQTKKPTEKQVIEILAPLGIKFQELGYEDISIGMKYFEQLADKFHVDATPVLVAINRDTKKGHKLAGIDEITEANIVKAVEDLK